MTPALAVAGLHKRFGASVALRGMDLTVAPGEVHGLVGRNGSGKSTLIKILSGYHAPDGGTAAVDGRELAFPMSPDQARRRGLAFVHQDLGLVAERPVVENLCLGLFRTTVGWRIDWAGERRRAAAALARFGSPVDPGARVGDLSHVDRAVVAIVRALLGTGRRAGGVLVLDEPTAHLPADAVDRLFAAVRAVAATGTAVVFVSHRLDEVVGLCDRVSVMRDGRTVAVHAGPDLTPAALVGSMLGDAPADLYPPRRAGTGAALLTVRDLAAPGGPGIDLDLARGEIVGLTGIVGAGHDEVLQLLFGAHPPGRGRVRLADSDLDARRLRPRAALGAGMALLPADRQNASGAQDLTVAHNVSLPVLRRFVRHGVLRSSRETAAVRSLLERLDVRPPDPHAPLRRLSGGNQQKALLGKWLQRAPRVLLLHEPTQGVDVGAKREIFAQLRAVADAGAGILIASTEYADLARLCDRVLVFHSGRPAAELHVHELTERAVVERCYHPVSTRQEPDDA